MSVLVVDDDPEVRRLVAWQLESVGFQVESAADAATALAALDRTGVQLLILDVSLPDGSGLDVLRTVREEKGIPVILLTARTEQDDRIRGLELGADDYVTKPFSPRELALRVTSILRRVEGDPQRLLEFGALSIDGEARYVAVGGVPLTLTAMEFDLLHFLARNAHRAYSKEQLLRHVWQSSSTWQSDATVTQHVHRLRSKLGDPRRLVTVSGGRYMFEPVA